MAIKVVITDAFSSLGQAILSEFETTHCSVLTPAKDELDWSNSGAVTDYFQAHQVHVVVNTLGYAEFQTKQQQVLLQKAAESIAAACANTAAIPIHMSSYRVFGGENKSSYDEQDNPSPISASGRAYRQAEKVFENSLEKFICLRLAWLIDTQEDTLFRRILNGIVELEDYSVTDQRTGAPIGLESVAKVVISTVQQVMCGAQNWGVYQYASGDVCTEAELAEVLEQIVWEKCEIKSTWHVDVLSNEALIAPGVSEPVSSVLSVRRCRDDFGVQPTSWRQGLSKHVVLWAEQHALTVDP